MSGIRFRTSALAGIVAVFATLAIAMGLTAFAPSAYAADDDLQAGQIDVGAGQLEDGQLETQGVSSSDVLAAYGLYGDVLDEWNARMSYERTHKASDWPPKSKWPYTSGHMYGSYLPSGRTNLVYTVISLNDNEPPFLIIADPTNDYRIWGIYGYDAAYNGGTLAYETYSMRQTVHLCSGRMIRSTYAWPATSDTEPHIYTSIGQFSNYADYYGDRIIEYTKLARTETHATNKSVNVWYDASGNVVERGSSSTDMLRSFEAKYPADSSIVWRSVSSGFSTAPFENGQISSGSRGGSSTGTKTAPTQWKRVSGNIALDTMSSIVREGFSGTGGTVVVATIDGYWDALAAAGLAGLANAPVLMTGGAGLSDQTRSELERLAPTKVFVCGGPAAVSDGVCSQIASVCGVDPQRIYGDNAVATAAQIDVRAPGATGGKWSGEAFLCTSDGYWDALAAAPLAYALHMPIFLTEADGTLSDATLAAIRECGITKVHIAGGTAAVNPSVDAMLGGLLGERFAGATAVETSELIANFGLARGMSANQLGVATTNGYWDALAGAALCGQKKSVLVLVSDANSSSIDGFVAANAKSELTAYVFGGPAAVSDEVLAKLEGATLVY